MTVAAAHLYVTFCIATIFFQIALIAGAPLGRYTQGGQQEGALPLRGRVFAGLSILILSFMAASARSRAGFPGIDWPGWTIWATVAVQANVTLLNQITPSAEEKRVWGPVTLVMLALLVVVVTG